MRGSFIDSFAPPQPTRPQILPSERCGCQLPLRVCGFLTREVHVAPPGQEIVWSHRGEEYLRVEHSQLRAANRGESELVPEQIRPLSLPACLCLSLNIINSWDEGSCSSASEPQKSSLPRIWNSNTHETARAASEQDMRGMAEDEGKSSTREEQGRALGGLSGFLPVTLTPPPLTVLPFFLPSGNFPLSAALTV